MAGGHVNRTVLQSFYQNPGQIYEDTKTEGAFETLAQQIDSNYDDAQVVTTAKIADGAVTAAKLDPALLSTDVTLNAHRTNPVLDHPDGSITTAKLRDGSVAFTKHDVNTQTALTGGMIYAYKNYGGL